MSVDVASSQVICGLEVVNRYCQTIFLGLLDDALTLSALIYW